MSYSMRKLSDAIPSAALPVVTGRLRRLQKQLAGSKRAAERLAEIAAQLRRAAAPPGEPFIFTAVLRSNEALLQGVFRDCDDIQFRQAAAGGRDMLLIYSTSLTDTDKLERTVLGRLAELGEAAGSAVSWHEAGRAAFSAAEVLVVNGAQAAIDSVMIGKTLLLADGYRQMLSIGATQFAKRNIGSADNQHVIRGPNEGFNETIKDNIALIRRRSRDASLKIRIRLLGERTRTSVALLYVADLVKPGLVEEVERRLSRVSTDKILSSAKLEEFIVDRPWAAFPQMQMTERPDNMVAALYEGRVGIIVDGTPTCIILPCTYGVLMQNSDDYTLQPVIASLIRLTRALAAFIAVFLPALYVAVVSYHPGMLPTAMAITIAELRARSPFPSAMEAIMMETLLELFQEAVIRLPKSISSAASMIGALVIGTTIVQAGIINPLLVVVIATTALASYSMPAYNFSMALRWLRVPMLIFASVLGLYGVILGMLALTVHLCALRSLGESFLGGIFNLSVQGDWRDVLIRLPEKKLTGRPIEFGAQENKRLRGAEDE